MRSSVKNYHPSIVFVEPTNRCNILCAGCFERRRREYLGQWGEIDLRLFKKLVSDIRSKTVLVSLYWLGEPLMNRNIGEMIAILNRNGIGSMIATNAMLLTREKVETLLDSGLDVIKIVISGMSNKTHQIYHNKSDISIVLKNIEYLLSRIKERRLRIFIMIDYLHFPHNTHEIYSAKMYFKNRPIHLNIRHGYLPDSKTGTYDTVGKLKDRSDSPCDWLWNISAVNWQGRVYPCCQDIMTKPGSIMGDLKKKFFTDICKGFAYQRLRHLHIRKARNKIPLCRGCHFQGIDFQ